MYKLTFIKYYNRTNLYPLVEQVQQGDRVAVVALDVSPPRLTLDVAVRLTRVHRLHAQASRHRHHLVRDVEQAAHQQHLALYNKVN